MRRGGAFIVAAVLLLAACGGSSSRLSASAYRAQIAKIKQEAASAQTRVGRGLEAKTVGDLKKTVDEFASDTQRIGDEVAKLKPPKNAEAVNTQLAQGLHDIAAAVRAASTKIATMKTAQAGISFLQHGHIGTKGSHEVGDALAKLQKLGYTSAS